jgi:hypothetical protein
MLSPCQLFDFLLGDADANRMNKAALPALFAFKMCPQPHQVGSGIRQPFDNVALERLSHVFEKVTTFLLYNGPQAADGKMIFFTIY